jgi:hypothetical protein
MSRASRSVSGVSSNIQVLHQAQRRERNTGVSLVGVDGTTLHEETKNERKGPA